MLHRKAKEQWRGFILLLAISSSFNLVKGQRLAQQKCEDYRLTTSTWSAVIPLTLNPTPIFFQNFNCSNTVQLITGGEGAKDGEFPHHVLLGFPRNESFDFKCGGTLISDLHVLTAAHCFGQEKPTIVRLGVYNTTYTNDQEYNISIADYRKHPQYRNTLRYHDIALVKLAKRLMLTPFIRPACLWDTEERNVTKYIATGFGAYENSDGVLSTTLRKVQLEDMPLEDCTKQFKGGRPRGIHNGQMCVGSKVEGLDTCEGDSGGPLQMVTNTRTCMYHIVGITSAGSFCGVGQPKAIYTKVSYYIDWIEGNVWGPKAL